MTFTKKGRLPRYTLSGVSPFEKKDRAQKKVPYKRKKQEERTPISTFSGEKQTLKKYKTTFYK